MQDTYKEQFHLWSHLHETVIGSKPFRRQTYNFLFFQFLDVHWHTIKDSQDSIPRKGKWEMMKFGPTSWI